jgi:hypothetical protein
MKLSCFEIVDIPVYLLCGLAVRSHIVACDDMELEAGVHLQAGPGSRDPQSVQRGADSIGRQVKPPGKGHIEFSVPGECECRFCVIDDVGADESAEARNLLLKRHDQ